MNKFELKLNRRFYRQIVSLWLGLWLITPAGAFALPSGGDIVSGSGSISTSGPDMTIQQDSQQLITNWQGFSIGAAESVHFNQPGPSAIALNRVIGVDPSIILGKLSGNGQVFLTNPSGVVFGGSAVVDVHGLIATTLNISDQDFLNGNYNFSQDPSLSLAAVINNGTINAKRYVGLLAPAVENNKSAGNPGSIIVADLGSVALSSGTAATLDFNGDGLISFAITKEVSGVVTDTDGNVINDRINNSGLIKANGGQVLLTAQSAKNVIGNVINHSGVIEAQTVQKVNGKVLLAGTNSEYSTSEVIDQAQNIERPTEIVGRPSVQSSFGTIVLSGGGEGDVQLAGTLDASRVVVTAGSENKGSGIVKVAAGDTLLTNNGDIAIVADGLDLEGDLNSGKGDVLFSLSNSPNLTLSPDGSMGADLAGDDLSHITANNLFLGSKGNIIVKGMTEESTQGISGSVLLVSGNNIIFNVGASVFSALDLLALNNVNVNQEVSTTRGDINITAANLNLSADLNSGTNDVIYSLWDGGDINLAAGSPKGGLSGDEIGHIHAENLILKTDGDINVDGITESNTSGIKDSVILESGNDINFKGASSVFPAVKLSAVNDINVYVDTTTTKGDFVAMADSDDDGKGDFNVSPGVIIASARDIDVSAPMINAEDDSFEETRDLILNGELVGGEQPPITTVETESIQQGSLGAFLTEFFENGGDNGGC